jgi:hypothetical protein
LSSNRLRYREFSLQNTPLHGRYLLDLAAETSMPREKVRATMAELENQRKAAAEALDRATDRRDGIEKLRRDVAMIWARFEQIRCEELLRLVPEDRRAVYHGLRLRVDVDGHGNARVSGVFDLDIAELLPTEGAYRVSKDCVAAKPYDGAVTLGSPSRGTSSRRGRRGRWR